MALLPVADGARLLGVHPKTLHHWLQQANVPFTTHPTDARMKCVREEQIQQVAALHRRPLRSPATTGPVMPKAQTLHPPEQETGHQQTAQGLPTFFSQETELIQRLASLETRMLTLQEQIAQLTLALLQERESPVEHRLTALESLLQPRLGRLLCAPPTPEAEPEAPCPLRVPRPLHPAEHLARSRRPPLIEYCAPGSYVIISSRGAARCICSPIRARGLTGWRPSPRSGSLGREGVRRAHRGYKHAQQTHFWSASRCVRRHTYKHSLGVTESVTIASLEQIAARLQSDIDAR
jgi:DNA-binding transcriptional MerR regulator